MNKFKSFIVIVFYWFKHNGLILFCQFIMLSLNIIELLLALIPSKKITLRKQLSMIAGYIRTIQKWVDYKNNLKPYGKHCRTGGQK